MTEKKGSHTKTRRIIRSLSILLFSAGVLLGVALAGSAAWADLEAKFYGFEKMGDKPLGGLRCPVVMTTSETRTISVTLTDPTDKPLQLMARADISNRIQIRTERKTLSLAPGEKNQLSWLVSSADIDLGFFIFAKVSTYPVAAFPFRESTCGIVVVNLPSLTGNQVFTFTLVASLLSIAIGLLLWEVSNRPLQGRTLHITYAMRFLTAVILAQMLISFSGWWVLGGILLVVAVLLIVVTVSLVLSQ
jgi:hypothetical protein